MSLISYHITEINKNWIQLTDFLKIQIWTTYNNIDKIIFSLSKIIGAFLCPELLVLFFVQNYWCCPQIFLKNFFLFGAANENGNLKIYITWYLIKNISVLSHYLFHWSYWKIHLEVYILPFYFWYYGCITVFIFLLHLLYANIKSH